jgi:hypothetical protein
VEDTNSLLVRASPSQWKSIREVIERIDVMPMQVHIEAQVVSVALKGALQYGVSWFFDNAVGDAGFPYPTGRNSFGSYSGGISQPNVPNGGSIGNLLSWSFLGNNAAAIVSALDNVTDVRTLVRALGVHPEQPRGQPQRRPAHPDLVGQPQSGQRQRQYLQLGAVPGHRHHPQGASAGHPRRPGVPRHRAGSQQANR